MSIIHRKYSKGFIFFLLFFLTFPAQIGTAAEDQELGIRTSPDTALFLVNNLKPGDWADRKLTIQNRGNKNFSYITEAKFKGGSEKLYNNCKTF